VVVGPNNPPVAVAGGPYCKDVYRGDTLEHDDGRLVDAGGRFYSPTQDFNAEVHVGGPWKVHVLSGVAAGLYTITAVEEAVVDGNTTRVAVLRDASGALPPGGPRAELSWTLFVEPDLRIDGSRSVDPDSPEYTPENHRDDCGG